MTRRAQAMPWIALVAVYFLWGSTYSGIRVAVATIPPYLMTGVRYTVAGVLLFAVQWLLAREKPAWPSRSQLVRIGINGVLFLAVANGSLCLAETRVESGSAALLIASSPIFMVLVDALRSRRPPTALAVIGIAIGTIGIVFLVGRTSLNADLPMAALILFSSFVWATTAVYARDTQHHTLTAPLEMTIGGAVSILAGLALGETSRLHVSAIAPESLWGMLWLVFGGAMLGYSAFAYVVRTLPTTTVATYGYVNPVVAVILGAVVLGEPVRWRVLAGGAAVVVSVALILLGSRRTAEEAVASG